MSIETVIAIVGGIVIPLIIWWNKNSQNRIIELEHNLAEQKSNFNDFRVKVAETYTTRAEIQTLEQKILSRLESLELKLDRILKINGSH